MRMRHVGGKRAAWGGRTGQRTCSSCWNHGQPPRAWITRAYLPLLYVSSLTLQQSTQRAGAQQRVRVRQSASVHPGSMRARTGLGSWLTAHITLWRPPRRYGLDVRIVMQTSVAPINKHGRQIQGMQPTIVVVAAADYDAWLGGKERWLGGGGRDLLLPRHAQVLVRQEAAR